MGRPGRPTKFAPKVVKKLLKALRNGATYTAACSYAGISYYTFNKWLKKGEQAKRGKFRRFFEEVQEAEHEAELKCIQAWMSQIPNDWRAAKDFLERRFPDRWGKRDTTTIEHKEPLKVIIERVSTNARDKDKDQ